MPPTGTRIFFSSVTGRTLSPVLLVEITERRHPTSRIRAATGEIRYLLWLEREADRLREGRFWRQVFVDDENGDLVVETVGLTPGNVTAGGRRSPETVLRERFQLSPDGKRLTITYTWEDPGIYVKPHSYRLFFERLPEGSYAIEDWCDPSDPATRQSIVPPKQLN